MIQKVKIVKADDSYSEKIANIEKNCFSDPWDINVIKESLQNENSDFFVALVMNTPVGYIGTYSVLDEVYLYNIAVEENYRNLKIGKALLQTVIDASIKKKACFISLEVRCSNIPAIKLYEKSDFKKAGLRKNFYKNPVEDAIIMTKYLKEEGAV